MYCFLLLPVKRYIKNSCKCCTIYPISGIPALPNIKNLFVKIYQLCYYSSKEQHIYAPARASTQKGGICIMAKEFNVTAVCIPEKHYMADISQRLKKIKTLIDNGCYFTINKARQYGKTTTLIALEKYLQKDYYVILLDFQTFGYAEFQSENVFAISFAKSFLHFFEKNKLELTDRLNETISNLKDEIKNRNTDFTLKTLFEELSDICGRTDKPVVLMVDETDSAANNQVFLDFLSQTRAAYIRRATQPAFQSVILASVYDIKNLKRKLRPDDEHKYKSPWNIATDFNIDMSLSANGIAGMLHDYENDYHSGMDIESIAGLLYEYTSGYPFLVSRLCKIMDDEFHKNNCSHKNIAWTKKGFYKAINIILSEKNTLFESLYGKLAEYPELNSMLYSLLFIGKSITYNPDKPSIDIAAMFGFITNHNGTVSIANRIFETRLYNLYLSTSEMHEQDIYKASLQDKNQFVTNGYLDMQLVLEKFVVHFNDLYGDKNNNKTFIEEEGRKYFLLYLRPIINGTGNYYIEARTRGLCRTDVIVDYNSQQYIIEMKIWHGEEYNNRGEKQLISYLDSYHQDKGYMISFNFNKNKKPGVHQITISGKTLVEAVV